MCAPKSPTGSNEPQKCFGRSDHVEALSQLGPLRSRKGMSQLGIPKMRQTSHFLRHKPSAVRCGTATFQSRGNMRQTPVQRVHGRHSAGSSRAGTRPDTLMDMRTELDGGATRRPRVPFPKVQYEPRDPGGLQEEVGPKRKKTNGGRTGRRRSARIGSSKKTSNLRGSWH